MTEYSDYKHQRKTLVVALRYLRKHKIKGQIRNLQYELLKLRRNMTRSLSSIATEIPSKPRFWWQRD